MWKWQDGEDIIIITPDFKKNHHESEEEITSLSYFSEFCKLNTVVMIQGMTENEIIIHAYPIWGGETSIISKNSALITLPQEVCFLSKLYQNLPTLTEDSLHPLSKQLEDAENETNLKYLPPGFKEAPIPSYRGSKRISLKSEIGSFKITSGVTQQSESEMKIPLLFTTEIIDHVISILTGSNSNEKEFTCPSLKLPTTIKSLGINNNIFSESGSSMRFHFWRIEPSNTTYKLSLNLNDDYLNKVRLQFNNSNVHINEVYEDTTNHINIKVEPISYIESVISKHCNDKNNKHSGYDIKFMVKKI